MHNYKQAGMSATSCSAFKARPIACTSRPETPTCEVCRDDDRWHDEEQYQAAEIGSKEGGTRLSRRSKPASSTMIYNLGKLKRTF